MEWQVALVLLFGSMFVLMLTGMPLAFALLVVNVVGAFFWFGGGIGLDRLISAITSALTSFTLLPVCLFILMGEAMFNSGLATKIVDAVDDWFGRLPGRLSLLAVFSGTLFGTFTGSAIGSCAMLGSALVPEMEKRGYKKPMSLGPILGSGGLALMVPPSSMAVLVGAIGKISIGRLLMAIFMPGLLMATLYVVYIVLRSQLQPSLAPAYVTESRPISTRLGNTIRYVLPLSIIIFLVTGVIFLGIGTPTEAAACGAVGTFLLAACYRRLNWGMVKKTFSDSMSIIAMVFMIVASAVLFSQLIAFTGASSGLVKFTTSLAFSPIWAIISMQGIVMIMGMFMPGPAIVMVAIPLFMPIVNALGFNPVLFGVLIVMMLEVSTTSPPFGSSLFVMKAVAPAGTTIEDCYRAALPFIFCDLIAVAIVIAFPMVALWLPGRMVT